MIEPLRWQPALKWSNLVNNINCHLNIDNCDSRAIVLLSTCIQSISNGINSKNNTMLITVCFPRRSATAVSVCVCVSRCICPCLLKSWQFSKRTWQTLGQHWLAKKKGKGREFRWFFFGWCLRLKKFYGIEQQRFYLVTSLLIFH